MSAYIERQRMLSAPKRAIARWMTANLSRFVDRRTGEVDRTAMVEAWDLETQDGGVTTDPDHEAWTVAASLADVHEAAAKFRARRDGGGT